MQLYVNTEHGTFFPLIPGLILYEVYVCFVLIWGFYSIVSQRPLVLIYLLITQSKCTYFLWVKYLIIEINSKSKGQKKTIQL